MTIDSQGPFPANQYGREVTDYLLNFMATFSGELILVLMKETGLTTQKAAKLHLCNILQHWGIPLGIHSDRGVQFESEFWSRLFKGLGTTFTMSSSYHLQMNRKIEHMHHTLNVIFH
jgi:transposase InsO family protein